MVAELSMVPANDISCNACFSDYVSDEDKNFSPMTRLEEVNHAALTIQRGWRWTRKRIVLRAASEERLQEKLREVWRRFVVFASGSQRQEKDAEPQGDAIHPEGC